MHNAWPNPFIFGSAVIKAITDTLLQGGTVNDAFKAGQAAFTDAQKADYRNLEGTEFKM
jgi:hypothetical protein